MLPFTASAAPLTNADAFWPGGYASTVYSHIDYWEDPGVASLGYDYFAANSRADYAGIANATISFYRQSTSPGADMRFFAGSYADDWYGYCQTYKADGTIADIDENFVSAHVRMNDRTLDLDNFSNSERHYNMLHELGHALSLAHQPKGEDTVMKQGQHSYTDPTSVDKSNIAWKY